MKIFVVSLAVSFMCVGSSFAKTKEQRYAEEMAKYEQTGVYENCIRHSSIKSTKILDDNHIIFKMRNRKVYLNTLSNGCRPLGNTRQFAVNVHGNRLCNIDFISVFDSMMTYGTCGLGKFELLEERTNQTSE